jgi:transcriptional regulator with XRE-family HTH domain
VQELFLGEYIKQRRLDLGLTQAQLCEGICESITISRLENGKQTPSRHCINALLQRLGLPDDRYVALLSKNEMEISALQKEIISCNVRHETEQGLAHIAQLESLCDPDDGILQQFILRSKVLLGKPGGEAYTPDEKQELLLRAIRLTVPRFDLKKIEHNLYSVDEVKVINQLADVSSKRGQHKRAIDIYRQLLRYVQSHFQNMLRSNGLLPLIAYNYARELDLDKQYEKSIEIAELGRKSCVQYGYYQMLPDLFAIKAECYYFLGQEQQSREHYLQAYVLYKSYELPQKLYIICEEAKRYLGMELST